MVECSKCHKAINQSQCTYQQQDYHNECCKICSPPNISALNLKEKSPPPPPKPPKPEPPEGKRAGPGKLNFAILGNFEKIPEVTCKTCKKPITGKRFLSKKKGEFNCQACYVQVADNKCFMCKQLFGLDEECFKDDDQNNLCGKCIKVYFANKKQKLAQETAAKPVPAAPKPVEIKPNCIHCDVCTKTISLSILQFEGYNYHDQCFSCCVCKSPLTTKHFYKEPTGLYCEKCKPMPSCHCCKRKFNIGESLYDVEASDGSKPYCNECYYKLYTKSCQCCSKPIDSGQTYLHFLENNYHMSCFTCCDCKKPVGEDGKCFYKNEKDARFCHACVKNYMEKNLNAVITTWTAIISIKTSTLLSCFQCKKAFGGGESFYRGENDNPFCVECYTKLTSKPCTGCSKQIGPSEQKLILDEQYYHMDCLKCAKCARVMKPTEDFYQIGKNQYSCAECINK